MSKLFNLSACAARTLALAALAFTSCCPSAQAQTATQPLDIRVVVVTTFEVGKDTGDTPGELQNWIERYPCNEPLPFPQGVHSLLLNRQQHVLCILTGVGKSHAAASIMALGLDPRFDLSKAYWILAGIGGIDPHIASIGSGVWANYVVDGDLAYEIDSRDLPSNFETGIIPYDRSTPFELPAPPAISDNGILSYPLNPQLTEWAFELTRNVKLDDTDQLKKSRAPYSDPASATNPASATSQTPATRPPFVLKGDTLTADRFWLGAGMTNWAEKWVPYWTGGKGLFVTSAEEDSGYMQALFMLSNAQRVDLNRVMDLRTASDFCLPPKGVSAVALLKSEATGNYAAYSESIENAYRLGSVVVRELATHWSQYAEGIPNTK